VFFLRVCCVLLAVRQVIQDVEVTVDVDAMILLDVSGSVGNPNWNKEVDVAKKVMDTLRDEVDNDHKKVGYVAWDSKVEDAEGLTDLVATPTAAQDKLLLLKANTTNIDECGCMADYPSPGCGCAGTSICGTRVIGGSVYNACPAYTGGRLFSGSTLFSNPLAECANQLLNNDAASQKDSAYKMCMLITDGEAQTGDDCTQDNTRGLDGGQACSKVCSELSLTGDCTAKKLAKELRDQKNVSVVTVCVGCPTSTAKKAAYCYSDCADKHGDGTFAACTSATLTYTDAQLEECTHYLIAEFDGTLDDKLVTLTKSLTTSLAKVSVGQTVTTEQESVEASARYGKACLSDARDRFTSGDLFFF
jgi:uncharacterized protein YegL